MPFLGNLSCPPKAEEEAIPVQSYGSAMFMGPVMLCIKLL